MRRGVTVQKSARVMGFALCALSFARTADASVFAGRWEGTVSADGSCSIDGKTDHPKPGSFNGYVLIEDVSPTRIELQTKDFPNGIVFDLDPGGAAIARAASGQTSPWQNRDGVRNAIGQNAITSGWLALTSGELKGNLEETVHIVKKRGLLQSDSVADCSSSISYDLRSPNAPLVAGTQSAAGEPGVARAKRKRTSVPRPPAAPTPFHDEPVQGNSALNPAARSEELSPAPTGDEPLGKGASYREVQRRFGEPSRKEIYGDYMDLYYKTTEMLMYGENGGECKISFSSGVVWQCAGCNTEKIRCPAF